MKSIIIDYEPRYFHSVVKEIQVSCPQIKINGFAKTCDEAVKLINEVEPSLIFMEVDMPDSCAFEMLKNTSHTNFETIFFSHTSDQALEAIKYQASGYVLKPLNLEELLVAIKVAENRIKIKLHELQSRLEAPPRQESLFPENIIGIPTMEGFEFIPIHEIVRCEGFQRCTRIVTADRSDIISSYHIGVFRKRLEPHCFYSTHKSHLINLRHIRKYLKEGSIQMADGNFIPVSKRRKSDFVKLLLPTR